MIPVSKVTGQEGKLSRFGAVYMLGVLSREGYCVNYVEVHRFGMVNITIPS